MDVFKIRKTRESHSSNSTTGTLDSLHQGIVQGLKESKTMQQTLQEELDELRVEISRLYSNNEIPDVVKANQLQLRVRQIEEELEHVHPVEEYYLKNMDLLDEYYKKQDTSSTGPTLQSKDANTFMKFFTASVPCETGMSRKQMFDEYVQRMKLSAGPDVVQLMTEHCVQCNVAREEISSEGILVCPRCGSEEYALVVSDFPSFRDPPKERNNYAYKKINHLNEILNQFQAKESTIIPEDVMNEVILEIRKRRISNIADLTEEDIRQILKKLNRSKYYEHRAHILSRLNGNPPPTITPEIEEKIRAMFQDIQAPFLLYCPNDRTNFLSYSYILYKFFELLDLDEYKVFFPLLKSRDRLIAHDQIWKKICDYLQWEFITSV
jgi:predicted  nucleic acid-binding Zn-ribbon protein